MTDEVLEVLVHISTPATKQNDALYHSLADAYLEFEPQSRYTDKPQRQQHEQKQLTTALLNPTQAPNTGSQIQVAADPSIFSTSKDSYGSFPSHLSLYDSAKGRTSTPPPDGSFENGSVLASSRVARLERIHMNWKDKTTPKSSSVAKTRRLRQTLAISDDADTTFIEDTQLAVQALQSQLQDTYSTTSEDTSEDDVDFEDEIQKNQLPHLEESRQDVGGSKVEVLASTRTTANTISSRIDANQQEELRLDDTVGLSLPSSELGQDSQNRLDNCRASVDSLDFTKLPVNAFPPAPKLSIAHPGTLPSQITKHLATIKAHNPTRFKPSNKVRNPDADDRGYWTLNCSHWPKKLQHEFWSSLCEQILTGRLGWGSTLHREISTQELGQVKLYCWGEVVEHMWLVLWLCSKGRISGSGSKWHDADGVAVFEVP